MELRGWNIITWTADNAGGDERYRCPLTVEGDWVMAVGTKPNINRAIVPAGELAKASGRVGQAGVIEFWFTRPPPAPGAVPVGQPAPVPDHSIAGVRIVEIEPNTVGLLAGGDQVEVVDYRVFFADSREQFVEPRGGLVSLDPIPEGTSVGELVALCLKALGLPETHPETLDDMLPPKGLRSWKGVHAAGELGKLAKHARVAICPKSDGTLAIEEPFEGTEPTVAPQRKIADVSVPYSAPTRIIIDSAPNAAAHKMTLVGPHHSTFEYCWQDEDGVWRTPGPRADRVVPIDPLNVTDAIVYALAEGAYRIGLLYAKQLGALAVQLGLAQAAAEDIAAGKEFRTPESLFPRMADAAFTEARDAQLAYAAKLIRGEVDPERVAWANDEERNMFRQFGRCFRLGMAALGSPILRFALDGGDGSDIQFEAIQPTRGKGKGPWVQSAERLPMVITGLQDGRKVVQFSHRIGRLDAAQANNPDARYVLPKYGDLKGTAFIEVIRDDGTPWYYERGYKATEKPDGTREVVPMKGAEVDVAMGRTGLGVMQDMLVLHRPELRAYIEDGKWANLETLDAKALEIATKLFNRGPSRRIQAVGFLKAELSGRVSEIRWSQRDLKTSVRIDDWYSPLNPLGRSMGGGT